MMMMMMVVFPLLLFIVKYYDNNIKNNKMCWLEFLVPEEEGANVCCVHAQIVCLMCMYDKYMLCLLERMVQTPISK